jgi:hypothetical protein
VDKTARKLTLPRNGDVLKTYDVSRGHAPLCAKEREGDGRPKVAT